MEYKLPVFQVRSFSHEKVNLQYPTSITIQNNGLYSSLALAEQVCKQIIKEKFSPPESQYQLHSFAITEIAVDRPNFQEFHYRYYNNSELQLDLGIIVIRPISREEVNRRSLSLDFSDNVYYVAYIGLPYSHDHLHPARIFKPRQKPPKAKIAALKTVFQKMNREVK